MFKTVLVTMLCWGLGVGYAFAREPQIIRHHQVHNRFEYQVELLQHVLDLTSEEYGQAMLKANGPVNIRSDNALMKDVVDVIFVPTSRERETKFIPVKIPLLQGMLGYRLLVVKPEFNHYVALTPSLPDFTQRFVGGSGIFWEDFRIYNHNKVVTKVALQYELLFKMLNSSEIDYFTLGANEIFNEIKARADLFPSLMINPEVAFFYPFPMYYFVRLNNVDLASRLEKGLLKAEADGSFRDIFDKHYQDEIIKLRELNLRHVFYLDNPFYQQHRPMLYHWWLDQKVLQDLPTMKLQ